MPMMLRARLPVEHDQNGRLAVGKTGIAKILDRVGYLADIGEVDRRAVAVGDDQRLVLLRRVGLVVRVDLVALVADVDAAFRAVGVGAGERGPHVLQADAVFVECLRNEIDPHGRQRTAADDHFADSLDLRQLLRQHRGRGVIELAARQRVGGQGQDHDRSVSRIDLAVGGIGSQAGRQVGTGGIDRGLHVARRAVDVAVKSELQGDARRSHRARRGHLGDVGDLPEMALKRAGDRGGDILRAGARQGRLHRDGRKVDLRQRRDRKLKKATTPAAASPKVSRVVATGRRIKRVEGLMARFRLARRRADDCPGEAHRQAVKPEIDHRRSEQRQQLADQQAADDGDAKRMPQFGARAGAEHQRQGAEYRGHRRHQDRPEPQQAGLVDRLARRLTLIALGIEREVDHHDRVLLHDADQKDDADDRDDRQILAGEHQRQQRTNAGGRQASREW